jgi:hypothetical protein
VATDSAEIGARDDEDEQPTIASESNIARVPSALLRRALPLDPTLATGATAATSKHEDGSGCLSSLKNYSSNDDEQ